VAAKAQVVALIIIRTFFSTARFYRIFYGDNPHAKTKSVVVFESIYYVVASGIYLHLLALTGHRAGKFSICS
jgi:hypothetical protein